MRFIQSFRHDCYTCSQTVKKRVDTEIEMKTCGQLHSKHFSSFETIAVLVPLTIPYIRNTNSVNIFRFIDLFFFFNFV